MQTGLIPRAEQAQHNEKIRTSVLKFLIDEIYSTVEILQQLMNYKTKQGALGLMKKLEKDGLVKLHRMKNFAGRGLHIWGITPRGIYAITDPDDLPDKIRGFEPSRISLATLDHKLQIQLVKIYLNELRWSIIPIDNNIWDKKLPDIVCTKPQLENELISLEIELTIKSLKRYSNIITTYKILQNEQPLRRVVWLTDTDKAAAQLRSIFKGLDESCLELHRFMSLDAFKGTKERH